MQESVALLAITNPLGAVPVFLVLTEGMPSPERSTVGVLLCSGRFGLPGAGSDADVAKGLALATNAAQLQVAAGTR